MPQERLQTFSVEEVHLSDLRVDDEVWHDGGWIKVYRVDRFGVYFAQDASSFSPLLKAESEWWLRRAAT